MRLVMLVMLVMLLLVKSSGNSGRWQGERGLCGEFAESV
jgi:hypothetical protein